LVHLEIETFLGCRSGFRRGAPAIQVLAALYFNFARYLLISLSQLGGLPANLQGIWAQETHAPCAAIGTWA
jgi:hypothetical protein